MVPAQEVAIGGIVIGDSPAPVRAKLGDPGRAWEDEGFLTLHDAYPGLRVSCSDDVVSGLLAESPAACTPRRLCPGDSLDRMRDLYGAPFLQDRPDGRYHEYVGYDADCFLQIAAQGSSVTAIRVACQP